MFGHNYCCTSCNFEFCSGWSHHAGGQFLVCTQCASHFVLGAGSSCWGPHDGEMLEFLLETEEGKHPTGVRAVVKTPELRDNEEWDGVFVVKISEVQCPHCHASDALVQSFAPNAPCPQCKTGIIEKRRSCIY